MGRAQPDIGRFRQTGGGCVKDMFESWTVLFAGLAYVGLLFAVATFGDRRARQGGMPLPRSFVYALSLGVYCTSWTYFGSVGVASRSGWDFLPIYIGPVIVFTAGWKLLQSIVDIAKRHRLAPPEQRPESLTKLRVAVDRQRSQREAVKAALAVDDAWPAGRCTFRRPWSPSLPGTGSC